MAGGFSRTAGGRGRLGARRNGIAPRAKRVGSEAERSREGIARKREEKCEDKKGREPERSPSLLGFLGIVLITLLFHIGTIFFCSSSCLL